MLQIYPSQFVTTKNRVLALQKVLVLIKNHHFADSGRGELTGLKHKLGEWNANYFSVHELMVSPVVKGHLKENFFISALC